MSYGQKYLILLYKRRGFPLDITVSRTEVILVSVCLEEQEGWVQVYYKIYNN